MTDLKRAELGIGGKRATFASPGSEARAAQRLTRAKQKTRKFKLKASDTQIALSDDGSVLGNIHMDPRNLKPRPGILDGQSIRTEIGTPWNGRMWQLRRGGQRLVEGRERRVLMLIATRRLFDVSLSFGEYLWSPGNGTTPSCGWTALWSETATRPQRPPCAPMTCLTLSRAFSAGCWTAGPTDC